MKLYKIWQEVNNNYDTYDSAVVCVENEIEARKYHPDGTYNYPESGDTKADTEFGSWVKKQYVRITYLGKASKSLKKGIVTSSYNAG